MRSAHLLLLFLTSAPLAAQRTWTVDASNGPGTDFTKLPDAVKAAAAGDTLVVRRGEYTTVKITKGIRVLGQPGATIIVPVPHGVPIPVEVTGVRKGEIVVLKGLRLTSRSLAANYLRVHSSNGTHVFEDLALQQPRQPLAHSVQVALTTASFHRCDISGGIRPTAATVTMSECTMYRPTGTTRITAPAVISLNSSLTLAACTVSGESAASLYPPTEAIRMTGGSLRLVAGPGSVIRAGNRRGYDVPALRGQSGATLVRDPAVQLVPAGNAAPHVGFASAVTRELPALTAKGGAIGKVMTIEMRQKAGHLYIAQVALPGGPLTVGPLGDLWLDARTLIIVTAGVQNASGVTTLDVPIANEPNLFGLPLAWQSIAGVWPRLEYSNMASATLH